MLTRPDRLLRLEAGLVLLASLMGYFLPLHGHWPLLAILFLVPDLALLGYASQQQHGAAAGIYNLAHTSALPVILGLVSWKLASVLGVQMALIWIAHIAFDRLLGFGLKYPQAFKPTHMQTVAVFPQEYGRRFPAPYPDDCASDGVSPSAGSPSS